jgi:AcrR family transcriptional regulator
VKRSDPPSVRIVTEIRRRIASGELREGDRVPSARQITREWGVAIATATKVLTALRQEGLVRAVPGVGTVVDASEPPPELRPEPRPATPPRASRRRQEREPDRELTRERIARAAIGIADAEGLAALSMRRIATELGVATMSLYRHVPGKDELVALMADIVLGDDEFPEPPPGWRARLEVVARTQWAIYRRHPWLAPTLSFTRPLLAPNGVAHTEWALSAVDGLGLTSATMLHIAIMLANYVRGTAVNFESEAEAERETGISDEEWMESQNAAFAAMLASGPFPTFSRLVAHDNEIDFDLDSLFDFGLRRVLDGIELLITERAAVR